MLPQKSYTPQTFARPSLETTRDLLLTSFLAWQSSLDLTGLEGMEHQQLTMSGDGRHAGYGSISPVR